MAWTYLAASEDSPEPLKDTSHQSPTVRSMITQEKSSPSGCSPATYQLPLFGTTLEPSKEPICPQSTSSTEVSPAKTFQWQAVSEAWQASEVVYFSRLFDSSKKYTLNLSFLKTYPTSALKDLDEFSKSWTASGMTVGGVFYPHPMWEPITGDPDGSSWPTPVAEDHKVPCLREMKPRSEGGWYCLRGAVFYGKPHHVTSSDELLNPQFVEWLMGYPTDWTAL